MSDQLQRLVGGGVAQQLGYGVLQTLPDSRPLAERAADRLRAAEQRRDQAVAEIVMLEELQGVMAEHPVTVKMLDIMRRLGL